MHLWEKYSKSLLLKYGLKVNFSSSVLGWHKLQFKGHLMHLPL